jgi:hypothetical protein
MPILRRNSLVRPAVLIGVFAVAVATAVLIFAFTTRLSSRHVSQRPVQTQSAQVSQSFPEQVSPAVRAQVASNYGKLPLTFEANQGQSDQ